MFHTKKIASIIMMTSLFLLFTINTVSPRMTSSFRCGNDLVSIGDRSFEVLKKCGEPVSKEQIGYTITRDKKRELKIDEWIYGPKNGVHYYLIFVGNELVEIKSIKDW